jgi:hypothetical protein
MTFTAHFTVSLAPVLILREFVRKVDFGQLRNRIDPHSIELARFVRAETATRRNSSIRATVPASYAGIWLDRMDNMPGSTAHSTGRGAVFNSGVLPEPGGPYTMDLTPYCAARVYAGRRSWLFIGLLADRVQAVGCRAIS